MPSVRWTPALAVFAVLAGCAAPEPRSQGVAQPDSSSNPRSDPPAQAPRGTPPEASPDPFIEAFVSAHNRVRASVSVEPIRWSPELAATAQAWAQRCVFEHSSTDLGENLSARTDEADPAQIVAAWAAEAQHYDVRRNRCEPGQVCGHYTQVVWRGTQQIGCAVARCDNAGPFGGGPWFNWVCNYDPPGNWQGERPY